ncbi:MAG: cytidine deaminase [Pirellula sp.]
MQPIEPRSADRIGELLSAAQNIAKAAYNPYSRFSVGCAILTKQGNVYCGCNIENASYSLTLCAERVAAVQAVMKNDLDWETMVVVSPERVSMCGACRQFLHEFAPGVQVWCGYLEGTDLMGPTYLRDLLPGAMSLTRIRDASRS